jgi:TolB-like protein
MNDASPTLGGRPRGRQWGCALAVACAALALQGCATSPMHSYYYGERAGGAGRTNLIAANERATDALLQFAPLDAQQPVLVSTLVSVDRLTESSRLGRIFSEQIAGHMVNRGLRVTEVKLRDNLLMQRDQGELLLSREVREVSQAQDAQAVVVGTYAVSTTVVYISLKLVNPVGNTVVAAHNYAVPMDENVRALLAGR